MKPSFKNIIIFIRFVIFDDCRFFNFDQNVFLGRIVDAEFEQRFVDSMFYVDGSVNFIGAFTEAEQREFFIGHSLESFV